MQPYLEPATEAFIVGIGVYVQFVVAKLKFGIRQITPHTVAFELLKYLLSDAESGEDDVEDVLSDVVSRDGTQRQRSLPQLDGPKVHGKSVGDGPAQATQRPRMYGRESPSSTS